MANQTLKTKADKSAIYLKSYPDYTKWDNDIEIFPMNELWENSAKEYANNILINFMGVEFTYGQIDNEIQLMASRLSKLGVKKGTHVGIFMANTPWFVITYHAIIKLGGVVVNFNPLYPENDLIHQVKDSEIELMVTLDLNALCKKLTPLIGTGKLKQVLITPFDEHLPAVKKVLFNIFKRKEIYKEQPSKTIHTIASIGSDLPTVKSAKVNVKDLAVLQYTGGTTGRSKGAMLSHANLSANVSQCGHWFPIFNKGEEKVATFLPLFHVFAMTVCMNFSIKNGAAMVMLPRFELKPALNAMKKAKGTMFPAVPTIFQAINALPAKQLKKLDSLKIAMSGGAGLPADTKEKFERLIGVEVVEGYGLSETAPVAAANPFNGKSKASCIGFPMPHTEISLRDLENPDKQVPHGERGEVCIRGPQVMMGYWKNDKANKDSFTKDGFFRTGDVAHFDNKGYCYIVDRIKDLILCGGFNVYPRSIEDAILTHPDVLEVTVIGVPDDYRGERPKAFVKLVDGATLNKDDLIAFVKPKLSPMERTDDIEFRDELPKTIIGKLSKKELREELK
ncbi:MAG: long-chain-fatty-acid--CoA ligase [Alphaproteobacteria bacterium]